jgi:NAD(P)-dependent dehydrogenase (short-subunit alcohol dehydrogenase family)
MEGDVASMQDDNWQKAMDINLTGVMRTARTAVPALVKRGGGAIVNVSSVAGFMGIPEGAAYAASKAAVLGLTRSMAFDYGPKGIRVNTLCPGWVTTPMSDEEMAALARERNISVPEAVHEVTKYLPLKRMATPEEIAPCAEFLASDDASFVTGAVLVADGGGSIVDVGTLAFCSE